MGKNCPSSGYTLIEIMVAISLILIITGGGLSYYSAFSRRQKVDQTAQTIITDMNLAKNLALSQQKPAGCDTLKAYIFDPVLSNPPSYSVYAECFNDGSPPMTVYSAPVKEINLEDITLSGLTRVRFEVLTQYVGTTGGNTLTVNKDGSSYSRQITISEGGGAIRID